MPTTETCSCGCTATEEQLMGRLGDVLDEYKSKPGALIPVLQITQTIFGYLPVAALRRISRELDKPYSEVAGVVSFYSYFSTVPRGKYVIRVCLGTACYVRGGKEVLDALKNKLKIDVGQTTGDRMFSIEVARCFGACGLAPTMSINSEVYKRVKPSRISEIIDSYYVKNSDGEKGGSNGAC